MPRAPGSSAIDPAGELTKRFASGLAQLWRGDGPLGVAVSGGPDSLALLLLAQAAFPGRVLAATVDHGLRAESAAEAASVAALCAQLGIAHQTLPVSLADTANIQAEARAARYTALADWMNASGAAVLLTAHHADDQAETLLLRLNRGSGVAGLAGVRARGTVPATRLPLVRPLLDWRRSELARIVADAGIAAADDPSNRDDRFDRARLRKAMSGADWLDVSALAASAAHLAEADAALEWAAAREWQEGVTRVPHGLTYRPQAPRAIALRVLSRIVAELDGDPPRGSAIARLFDSLVARQTASIGNLVARPLAEGWTFTKAPARKA